MSFNLSEKEYIIRLDWPNLTETNFTKSSEYNPYYNCIAFAAYPNAEELDQWWWPGSTGAYWPNSNRAITIDNFRDTFQHELGYEVCDSGELVSGYEKVALYVDVNGLPTHMSRQLDDGKWVSKLGRLEDIRHEDGLQILDGPLYGKVILFMKRTRVN